MLDSIKKRIQSLGKRQQPCLDSCTIATPMLCDVCKKMLAGSRLLNTSPLMLPIHKTEKHKHSSPEALAQSKLNCRLCALLYSTITAPENEWVSSTNKPLTVVIQRPKTSSKTKHVNPLPLKIWVAEFPGPIALVTRIEPHNCDFPTQTNSQEFWDLARKWVQSCLLHAGCNEDSPTLHEPKPGFVPTRLLALGSADSQTIRLIEKAELRCHDKTIEYTALSHCWGGQIKQQLVMSNLAALKQSITITDLPKNFQDAVLITQKLGCQYLWIDSLCIIQDSQVDWVREAATMGRVYASAQCTISASAASDSTGGCFFDRTGFNDGNVCILEKREDFLLIAESSHIKSEQRGKKRDDQMTSVLKQQNVELDELFDEYVMQSPLAGRGWAFQERLLSRRMLHFCHGTVLFECNTLRASEHHPDGVPYDRSTHLLSNGALLHKEVDKMESAHRELKRQKMERQRALDRQIAAERERLLGKHPPFIEKKIRTHKPPTMVGPIVVSEPSREYIKQIPNPAYTGPRPRILVETIENVPEYVNGGVHIVARPTRVKRMATNPKFQAAQDRIADLERTRKMLAAEKLGTAMEINRTAALRGMRGTFQMLLNITQQASWEEMVEFHDSWYELVQQYSMRALTKSNDRALAIAGVADFIQKSSNAKFVAGMWRSTLAMNLLWNVEAPTSTSPRGSERSGLSPSWAWISVTGTIETQLHSVYKIDGRNQETNLQNYKALATNVRYDVVEEKGGCILNAHLELSGSLHDFEIFGQNVIQDDSQEDLQHPELLQCLPILRRGSRMDGIVVKKTEIPGKEEAFIRVGYFWNELAIESFESSWKKLKKRRITLV